ncbi:sigma-54-dependent transcriptional regulator [Halocynthiibacter namhaensis]|uniref:sigma-54-dependent transcriptional regulator n=1 Tax=Halocynthiibacter namhaensis TaxID=1290553 RepID=UPI00138DE46E|nr:sigma 54-interacting transcriptional regulator [Halocynthiibacter namhaensis]
MKSAGHICFVPMHNLRGDLTAVYIISGENTLPERLKSTDMRLILRAVSARVEQSNQQRAERFHISALERSLKLADKQRSDLRERARSNLKARLPGRSNTMKSLRDQVSRLADFQSPILIVGESGTNKEQVAREIHRLSRTENAPFVYVNCAILTQDNFAAELFGHKRGAILGMASARRGLLREAGDGMIYFDRVDLLSVELQTVLLRILETGYFRPLGSEREHSLSQRFAFSVPEGNNLENVVSPSLYHKIAQATVLIPPLRTRQIDIEVLAHEYLIAAAQEHKRRLTFRQDSIPYLSAMEFPGNDRELQALISRSCHQVKSDGVITPMMLGSQQDDFTSKADLRSSVESYEAMLIQRALCRAENNRAQAAKRLGIPKRTLADKCLRYGL